MHVGGRLDDLDAHVRSLLLQGRSVVCELHGAVDLDLLDRLGRLRLLAGRLGVRLEVRAADPGLLELTGLSGVLCGQPLRQAEAREQRGVEEVVDVDELPG